VGALSVIIEAAISSGVIPVNLNAIFGGSSIGADTVVQIKNSITVLFVVVMDAGIDGIGPCTFAAKWVVDIITAIYGSIGGEGEIGYLVQTLEGVWP
jgi:hypothetical protein